MDMMAGFVDPNKIQTTYNQQPKPQPTPVIQPPVSQPISKQTISLPKKDPSVLFTEKQQKEQSLSTLIS